jgi:hypothetical protein
MEVTMKPREFNQKLSLNKKTVANLNSAEMRDAYGGVHPSVLSLCVSCPSSPLSIVNCCICKEDQLTEFDC